MAIDTTIEIVAPFPLHQLPRMWGWLQEFHDQMVDDFSPQTFEQLVLKARADAEAGGKSFAITKEGRLVGCLWGEHVGNDVYSGHLVFDRDELSPAEKLEAAKEAMHRFFEDGARKIRWMALPDNRAYRLFLRKLGAGFEGELKQETKQGGELKDLLLFASFPNGR